MEVLGYVDAILAALRNKTDRNIILIALLNASYPFSFEVLRSFGKFFSVQDSINTYAVAKPSQTYTEATGPPKMPFIASFQLFVEAEFFRREKVGLYSVSENHGISSKIAYEIYIESIKINVPLFDLSLHLSEPYLFFIKMLES